MYPPMSDNQSDLAALDNRRAEESESVGLPDGHNNNLVRVAGSPLKYYPKVTRSAPYQIIHWQSLVYFIDKNVIQCVTCNTPGIK